MNDKNKKILLVNPSSNVLSEVYPIGLLYLGSYLKQNGHDVLLMDKVLGHEYHNYMTFKPDVVAITAMTPYAYNAYSIARSTVLEGYYTVLGGIHPSCNPKEALGYCNAVVVGEGEESLLKLIDTKEEGIIQGEEFDLDKVPVLDFSIADMEHYCKIRRSQNSSIWSFVLPFDRVGATMTSRGCPFSCTYCWNSTRSVKARYRNIDNIIEELKVLKNTYKVDAVHFFDDNFLLNKKRTEELCDRIKEEKLGIYYSCSARASDITDDILEMLRNAGFLQIAFGFESGSQRILDILKKGIKVDDITNAINLCNKHDFTIQGSFMFGNPTETLEEMKLTENIIKNYYMDGGIGTFITTPYPGTKIWDWAIENDRIPDNINWNDLAFHKNPPALHNVPKQVFLSYFNDVISYSFRAFENRINNRINRAKKIKEELKNE